MLIALRPGWGLCLLLHKAFAPNGGNPDGFKGVRGLDQTKNQAKKPTYQQGNFCTLILQPWLPLASKNIINMTQLLPFKFLV